jgi:hypothetical protein
MLKLVVIQLLRPTELARQRQSLWLEKVTRWTSRYLQSFSASNSFHGRMLRHYNTIFFHDGVAPAVVGAEDWEISSGTKAV